MTTPRLVTLQRVADQRGGMYVGTHGRELPFQAARFFIIDNERPVPAKRGGHAHRWQSQLLVAVAGSTQIDTIDADGLAGSFRLGFPDEGLYIPPGVWVDVEMAWGTRLLVLASGPYDEAEYIRDRAAFDRVTA